MSTLMKSCKHSVCWANQTTILHMTRQLSCRGMCKIMAWSDYHCSCKSNIYFYMMTSSNGNIFRVTGPLCGEFTGPGEFPTQRPVTRSFDVFFDVRLIKRLSKHSRGWWFETLSHPLWRHRNVFFTSSSHIVRGICPNSTMRGGSYQVESF